MPVAQKNRDRLRGALLGPLGQEVTDMLMEELDHAGLRAHVDERFKQVDKRIDDLREDMDRRFDEVDKRFERVEKRLDSLTDAIVHLSQSIGDASRPANAMVYTVCGTVAVVAVAALLQGLLGG